MGYWHGTPATNAGTSQKVGEMFFCMRRVRWKLGVNVCFVVLLTILLLSPRPSESWGYFTYFENQHLNSELHVLNSPLVLLVSERASSSMVRTIMALLATFDEAGILPPEGTPQANQVIHGLIQLQAALIKSSSPELAAYRDAALAHWTQENHRAAGEVAVEGLTDGMLAALVGYDLEHSLWEDQSIVAAFREFNVTPADWQLIVELFHKAEGVFRNQGRTIHEVYETWRMAMPGGKS